MGIVKLTVWLVPAQREREARWDAELVRTSGTHERLTGIPGDLLERLMQDAAEVAKRISPTRSR